MTKLTSWNLDINATALAAVTPAEQAFLRDAERIALEVADMSEEDVADYLVEHNLQDLVAPERVDALLAKAMEQFRNRPAPTTRGLTVKDILNGPRIAREEPAIPSLPGKDGGVSDDQKR